MKAKSRTMPDDLNQLIRRIYAASLDPARWTPVLKELGELVGCDGASPLPAGWPARDSTPNEALSSVRQAIIPAAEGDPGRHRAVDAYERGDLDLLRALDEHLLQAMQITEKMSAINHQQHLLQHAFDRLSDAIFFLGSGHSVLIANRAANTMIEAKDGLQTINGALTATHRPTAEKLRMLIADMADSAPDQVRRFDALPIPKSSDGRPLHLLAMPAVTAMEEQFSAFLCGKPTAFVVVSDPDRQPALPEDRLMAIFGLTGAEARLAAALASGVSVADYAVMSAITENTARWTLKQVQAKTDCRRQADLVRLLVATAKVFETSNRSLILELRRQTAGPDEPAAGASCYSQPDMSTSTSCHARSWRPQSPPSAGAQVAM